MFNQLSMFVENLLNLIVLSAPWLLFGFVMAAMIKAFIKLETMQRYLGGSGAWVTVKAALIGAPLPLCSCGVVPAALGLRSAGASKNATVAFLVSTPETGVDSISFTYALMGPVMAIARPIAAITSAIVAGLLVGKAESEEINARLIESEMETTKSCCAPKIESAEVIKSCCSSTVAIREEAISDDCCEPKLTVTEEKTSCCASKETMTEPVTVFEASLIERFKTSLQFAFGKMLKDIVNWLVIGLIVAALVQTFLPSDFFVALGDGFFSMLVMAVIGIPMYVCASASTPIAAGFLLAGLSPGAVLVFMLLGPASNIGTIMIIKNELGLRAVSAYLIGLVFSAFFFGFALNFLADIYQWDFVSAMQIHEHNSNTWYELLAAIVLGFFVIKALAENLKERFN